MSNADNPEIAPERGFTVPCSTSRGHDSLHQGGIDSSCMVERAAGVEENARGQVVRHESTSRRVPKRHCQSGWHQRSRPTTPSDRLWSCSSTTTCSSRYRPEDQASSGRGVRRDLEGLGGRTGSRLVSPPLLSAREVSRTSACENHYPPRADPPKPTRSCSIPSGTATGSQWRRT